MQKRPHGAGFLRPRVLLYGEDCPDELEITNAFKNVLRKQVDAVIIVGTRLEIRSLKEFAENLLKSVQSRSSAGTTVWVSTEEPKLGDEFDSCIKYKVIGDCDTFASFIG